MVDCSHKGSEQQLKLSLKYLIISIKSAHQISGEKKGILG